MRKVRYLILVAAVALLSAALAGSALPATSLPQASAAQSATKKPVHKAAKPKPKPKKKAPAKKKTTTTTATASALAFTGSYSGQASSKINSGTADISANGTGTANLIGAGTITGSGTADSSQQPCPPFGGTGTITGAKGNITFSVVKGANGCGDDGGHNFSLVGYLQIVKATGALAGVSGQLRFTGNYSRDDGTFSIKLSGTLKK